MICAERYCFGHMEMISFPLSCCRLIEKLKTAGLLKDSSHAASSRKNEMQRVQTPKDGGIPVEVNDFRGLSAENRMRISPMSLLQS